MLLYCIKGKGLNIVSSIIHVRRLGLLPTYYLNIDPDSLYIRSAR